jgi:hypothetical protein
MSAAAARARVLAGYRNLTRARIQLFKGDDYAMKESGRQLREQFEINKNVPTSGPTFEELLQGMDEAAHMLRHEIVRGDLNEQTGRYGTYYVRRLCRLFSRLSCRFETSNPLTFLVNRMSSFYIIYCRGQNQTRARARIC